jgi:hypothetical protein
MLIKFSCFRSTSLDQDSLERAAAAVEQWRRWAILHSEMKGELPNVKLHRAGTTRHYSSSLTLEAVMKRSSEEVVPRPKVG